MLSNNQLTALRLAADSVSRESATLEELQKYAHGHLTTLGPDVRVEWHTASGVCGHRAMTQAVTAEVRTMFKTHVHNALCRQRERVDAARRHLTRILQEVTEAETAQELLRQ